MNDLLPPEPPLIAAHERLAVALAFVDDYDYLEPQLSADRLASLALRMQLIIATAAAFVETLAMLTRKTILASAEAPPQARVRIDDIGAAEEAWNHLTSGCEKLRWVHDSLAAARKHLALAQPEIPAPPDVPPDAAEGEAPDA